MVIYYIDNGSGAIISSHLDRRVGLITASLFGRPLKSVEVKDLDEIAIAAMKRRDEFIFKNYVEKEYAYVPAE